MLGSGGRPAWSGPLFQDALVNGPDIVIANCVLVPSWFPFFYLGPLKNSWALPACTGLSELCGQPVSRARRKYLQAQGAVYPLFPQEVLLRSW